MLEAKKTCREKNGKVFLIGSGPGDPGLITVKGKKILDKADCIIYDFLASEVFIKNRAGLELIYVGKTGKKHTMEQEEINALIVQKAKEGKTVARLKGGDPFIFGRGGEEALELSREGIEFEIVPGISSAYGAPAYAGIPVTHRGITSTVAFITGHEDPAKEKSDIEWEKISTGIGTLVFLMGMKNLPYIAENLIKYGRSPDEEIALIQWGTTSRQKVLVGTLKDIAGRAEKEKFTPPAVIVVGKVVSLRNRLAWFDSKPLLGKTFIVTRTRQQAGALTEKLMAEGARVIEIPTIKIVDPESWQGVDEAIKKFNNHYYQWIIFTSPNGVEKFFYRLNFNKLDSRIFSCSKIAVIGPATAEALKRFGLDADLTASEHTAEGILDEIGEVSGQNILIARAKEARDILPQTLQKTARAVDIAVVYETITPEESRALLNEAVKSKSIDMITFSSSSTACNFYKMLENKKIAAALPCASIGPVTTKTAQNLGFKVAIEAKKYTIDGLLEAIKEYYSKGD